MKAPQHIGLALLFLLVALLFTGLGVQNGDQAVYLDQAARGAFTERWIHVGYVWAHTGWGTAWRSDVVSAVAGSLCIWGVGRRMGSVAGGTLGLLLLPAMPFGEVDLWWFAGLVAGVLGGTAGLVGLVLGTSMSPTLLAAVPWLAVRFGDRRWLAPVATVVGLTVLSGGAWWMGQRGVLTASYRLAPHAVVWPGLVAMVVLARHPSRWEVLALAPLLLAPSDVPAGWIGVLAVVFGRSPLSLPIGVRAVALAALVISTSLTLRNTATRVVADNAAVRLLAQDLTPADAVTGSWSWRVRVSLAATGTPDGFSEPDHARRVIELPSGRVIERP